MAQQSEPMSEQPIPSRRPRGALGTLESRLMEVLWGSALELSVQHVCDALGPGHNYKTVMTVLNRLVEKDLLTRQLDGRAYRYRPRQTRPDFLRSTADDLVSGYLDAYGQEAAEHLAGAAEAVAPRRESTQGYDHASTAFGGRWGEHRSPLRFLLLLAVLVFLLTRSRRERR